MSEENSRRFDAMAAHFDAQPQRAACSAAIASALSELLGNGMPRLLDYGCGTGACSLPLASRCESVTGMDVSAEMLKQFKAKAALLGSFNVDAIQGTLDSTDLQGRRFDFIVCALTMHHVEDVTALLDGFVDLLARGGSLALADLDSEDGGFHEDMQGVYHKGFSRDWVIGQLTGLGLKLRRIETVFTRSKAGRDGHPRAYPIFLICADKA